MPWHLNWLRSTRSLDWISAVTVLLPPAQAKTGLVERTEQVHVLAAAGADRADLRGALLWNTNAKRDTLALMISS